MSKCLKKILVLLYIILGAESFAEVILNLGWFVDTAVVSEVLLFRLHIIYGLLLGSVLQPRDGAADPFEQLEAERKTRKKTKIRWWWWCLTNKYMHQGSTLKRSYQSRCTHAERFCMFWTHITGQLLIVLHHLLVLLVDSQYFADTICGCLSLSGNRVMSRPHSDWMKHDDIKSIHCTQSLVRTFTCICKDRMLHIKVSKT